MNAKKNLSKFINKTLKDLLHHRGYQIFRRYYYDLQSDDSIRKILKNANVDNSQLTILDVGANVGQSIERFRRYLPNAEIYSFEPNPNTFK